MATESASSITQLRRFMTRHSVTVQDPDWYLAYGGGHSQLTVRGCCAGARCVAQKRMGCGRHRGTIRNSEGVGRGCARRASGQDHRFYEMA